jgi:sterol desaturase/sphingolipid hydroxylase (fatty acid hydroxylase superfamily)
VINHSIFFLNPQNRLFYLYILSALILTIIIKRDWRLFFNKDSWLSSSAILDYKIFVINNLLKVFLIAPLLFGIFETSSWFLRLLYLVFGNVHPINVKTEYLFWIFTISSFVLNDFARFFFHYLFHKIPILWKFHQTHHSAEHLNPITLFRSHPIEMLLAQFRNVITLGLISALTMFTFGKQVGGIDILGVNIIGFFFNILGSNLRHSKVYLGFGPFEKLFISPAQHQLHHGLDEKFYDKNFGVVLSIWDRVFGTLIYSKDHELKNVGLKNNKAQTLKAQLIDCF